MCRHPTPHPLLLGAHILVGRLSRNLISGHEESKLKGGLVSDRGPWLVVVREDLPKMAAGAVLQAVVGGGGKNIPG